MSKPEKPPKVVVRERSEIIKRRLANPNSGTAMEIPLKEPHKWQLRTFNADAATNRLSYAQQKGWVFVDAADVAGPLVDYGIQVLDGRLVMGERSKEVLMKMLREDWRDIQKAKAERNIRETFGAEKIKSAIVERASQEEGGDQGADFLSRSLKHIEIHDSLEKIPEAER